MDFGVVGLDGFAGSSDIGFASSDQQQQQEAKNNKRYGSGFQKLDGSGTVDQEDCWRSSKQARSSDDFSAPKTMLQLNTGLMRTSSNHFSADGQNLLSFSSSPKSKAQNATLLPSYFQQAVSAYTRNTGNSNNSGSLNGAFVHWTIAGGKGPFTPSQWMELEHQALIYKYITANLPIPSNLLIPIKKAFDSAGLFSTGLLRSKSSNTLGWGSIHLGYGNSTDPEPGRCRRTDGKKWRCWRDAVPDQKYCERHINRGRHRSRKPVEGQAGQSVAETATTINSKKVMQDGGGTSSLGIANQQLKSLQPHAVASNSSAATQTSRMFVNKESVGERMQHTPDMSMLSKESTLLIQKQQLGYEESSRSEFGLVTSDALLNPSQKRASDSVMSCGSFGSSSQNLTEGGGTDSQHPLRHFIEDWPKTSSDRPSVVAWPDHLDMQSDRTQLSISIPKAAASSDFIPSTSSTNNEKFTLSPLRMSRELDSVPMGLGVSSNIEQNTKESSWIPITWEPSLGGPLGEVLHQTHINAAECKKSSVLNLMTEGWDNNSPSSLGSSPTGVLQRTGFGSVSNSSAGSSPRAEIRSTHEGASQCNELLMFPAL